MIDAIVLLQKAKEERSAPTVSLMRFWVNSGLEC